MGGRPWERVWWPVAKSPFMTVMLAVDSCAWLSLSVFRSPVRWRLGDGGGEAGQRLVVEVEGIDTCWCRCGWALVMVMVMMAVMMGLVLCFDAENRASLATVTSTAASRQPYEKVVSWRQVCERRNGMPVSTVVDGIVDVISDRPLVVCLHALGGGGRRQLGMGLGDVWKASAERSWMECASKVMYPCRSGAAQITVGNLGENHDGAEPVQAVTGQLKEQKRSWC